MTQNGSTKRAQTTVDRGKLTEIRRIVKTLAWDVGCELLDEVNPEESIAHLDDGVEYSSEETRVDHETSGEEANKEKHLEAEADVIQMQDTPTPTCRTP